MKLVMFSVYDKAIQCYMPPFFARSHGEALRSFTTAVNERDHQFHKYASDYTLFMLGSWDDGGSVFEVREPVRVISALECIVQEARQNEMFENQERANGADLRGGGVRGEHDRGILPK